jgi:hypothetical protein
VAITPSQLAMIRQRDQNAGKVLAKPQGVNPAQLAAVRARNALPPPPPAPPSWVQQTGDTINQVAGAVQGGIDSAYAAIPGLRLLTFQLANELAKTPMGQWARSQGLFGLDPSGGGGGGGGGSGAASLYRDQLASAAGISPEAQQRLNAKNELITVPSWLSDLTGIESMYSPSQRSVVMGRDDPTAYRHEMLHANWFDQPNVPQFQRDFAEALTHYAERNKTGIPQEEMASRAMAQRFLEAQASAASGTPLDYARNAYRRNPEEAYAWFGEPSGMNKTLQPFYSGFFAQ